MVFLWVFGSYCDFRCCFSRTIFNGFKTIYSVIAINVVFTLADKNISKAGHLGGFVGGVIAMLVLIGSGLCVY